MTHTETITTHLAALRRSAPESTLHAVLRRTDLADEYTLIEGPTGPAYIAWNGRGITVLVPVEAVGSPSEFETRHPWMHHSWKHPRIDCVNHLDHAIRERGDSAAFPSISPPSVSSSEGCSRSASRSTG